MANSYTLPTSGAGAVPSSDATVSGQILAAETIGKLTGLINYTHAHLGCAPVISQGWPDAVFSTTGTPADYNCTWRIPIPSNAHGVLVLLVRASNQTSNGALIFEEQTNSNTTSVSINAGSSTWFRDTLSVGAQAGTYLELQATATSGGGTTFVDYISVHWEPLASPLAAGEVAAKHTPDPITPLGASRSAADKPLSSARGKKLIGTLAALASRPRPLLAWSGLQRVIMATAPKTMTPSQLHDVSALIRSWGGSRQRGHEYYCHVYAATHGTGDDRLITWRDQRQTIAAAVVAPVWVVLTTDEPDDHSPVGDGAETALIRDGLTEPSIDNRAPASPVYSVAIWGP